MATTYQKGHTPAVLRAHGARTASNTCQYFTPLLKPDHHVLDVGCGPGSITATLAPLVGHITGIDTSEAAIKAASSQPNLPENTTFRTGDAMALPFGDGEFDVVYTSQVLCHLPDPVSALVEFRRVLKPGGFVACREADAGSLILHPEFPGGTLWRQLQAQLSQKTGAHTDAGRMLLDWALQAGFEDGKVNYSAGDMTYAGETREKFGRTMATRTREDGTYRANAVGTGLVDEEGLERMAGDWDKWAGERAGVFSLICGQVVCYK
ncbi:methyltransferase type 11 [Mycena polygramma]|nr:methyltransferase type 11 [Mycena polygramma]